MLIGWKELTILFVFQLPNFLEEPVRGWINYYFLFCFIQFDKVVFCQKFRDVLNLKAG